MTFQLINGVNYFKLIEKVGCLKESQNICTATTACTKGSTEEVLNVVYASEKLHEHVFRILIGTTCHWFRNTFLGVTIGDFCS